jgi:hypothetical protein
MINHQANYSDTAEYEPENLAGATITNCEDTKP